MQYLSPRSFVFAERPNNIRNTHFSRNPKIAEFLKTYHYVKEFGEGVDRMCFEMSKIGLPEPEFSTVGFMTKVIVKNNINADKLPINTNKLPIKKREEEIIQYLKANMEITNKKARELLKVSYSTAKQLLQKLVDSGKISAVGEKKGRKYTLK